MKSAKSLNPIFWVIEYWLKALQSQLCWRKGKLFFWEIQRNLATLQKLFLYIGVSYKSIWKSVEILNWNLRLIELWFKVSDCQIWWTNIKLFFWETKTNLGTLEKPFPSIGVSYKFLLKSVKSLNRIFWAMDYSFKALQCQIWSTNTNHFSGKTRQNLKLSKIFFSIFKFPLTCSGVCQKPKSNIVSGTMLVQGFRLPNLVEEYKTIFLRKHGKSWNSPKTFFLFWSFL